MLDALIQTDRELTLVINSLHATWLDPVMIFFSEKWVWLPMYGFLLLLVFRNFTIKTTVFILIGVGLTVLLSDQTTSGLMKPFFHRLRPCFEPDLIPLLHLPNGCGGKFGFASSHAANTFGLASFFLSILKSRYKALAFLFLWATLVSWSRIYLGAHYFGDVVVGGLIGAFWSWIITLILHRYFPEIKQPK